MAWLVFTSVSPRPVKPSSANVEAPILLSSLAHLDALLGRLNFILDIYHALDVLANHPSIDPARIALMDFSCGGQATLYASLKRFHRLWHRSGVEFTFRFTRIA